MVHIANAGPGKKGPIFFNVDKPVGQGPGVEPNSILSADVQLVQCFLKALGFYRPNETGFSGRNDQETVQAIIQFQLNHTSPKPDGRISVATGETFAPGSQFAIFKLNELVRKKFRTEWPRIHAIGGVPGPPVLQNRLTEIFGEQLF